MKKIILKVHDLEFENNPASVDAAIHSTAKLLQTKGYTFGGMFVDVKEKVAHVWKTVQPKPTPPLRKSTA
jgi:hypothetical protein